MEITVLERPGKLTSKAFDQNLQKALMELKSELTAVTRLIGFSGNGWARIELSGKDSEILAELISNKFCRAIADIQEIETGGIYDGTVNGVSSAGLEFDVGIERPSGLRCAIPIGNLRAQLADGKAISCLDLIEDYCFFPGLRISVRITTKSPDEISGWLSDSQLDRIYDWIATRLDRIQVFDCYKEEVESGIVRANLSRDIIAVEPITLTMQSVVCKLGTDAVGLIPKLGSALPRRVLKPFIPRRIMARCRPW